MINSDGQVFESMNFVLISVHRDNSSYEALSRMFHSLSVQLIQEERGA